MTSDAELIGRSLAGDEEAFDRSFAEARPWLYGVALNRLRRYWRSRPAEDLVPDLNRAGRPLAGRPARPCRPGCGTGPAKLA